MLAAMDGHPTAPRPVARCGAPCSCCQTRGLPSWSSASAAAASIFLHVERQRGGWHVDAVLEQQSPYEHSQHHTRVWFGYAVVPTSGCCSAVDPSITVGAALLVVMTILRGFAFSAMGIRRVSTPAS